MTVYRDSCLTLACMLAASAAPACSVEAGAPVAPVADAGGEDVVTPSTDTDGDACVGSTCQASRIEHAVLIVQENHAFDAYFGRYCQAPSGPNPA